MTKAEMIFIDTKNECKKSIKEWGFERNPNGKAVGFNRLHTEEIVCVRTLNDVQKEIDKQMKQLKMGIKFNAYTEDEATMKAQVLEMVQVTLDNHRAKLMK